MRKGDTNEKTQAATKNWGTIMNESKTNLNATLIPQLLNAYEYKRCSLKMINIHITNMRKMTNYRYDKN